MGIFHGYVSHNQMVNPIKPPLNPIKPPLNLEQVLGDQATRTTRGHGL